MRLNLSILFFFIITNLTFGQERDLNNLTVGFSCGINPQPSQLVVEMTDLIKKKKYVEIAEWLKSKNGGKIYLSILVLERLNKNNSYSLNDNQKKFIERAKTSKILVVNCFGCFRETNSMDEMFEEENFIGELNWLNKMIPIE